MRIRGFFHEEKSYIRRLIYVAFLLFAAGIAAGSVYCAFLDEAQNSSLSRYLSQYFGTQAKAAGYMEVFKSSLLGYLKSFVIIYLCSFVRPGIIGSAAAVVLKGFSSGFSTASFVKLYGVRGLLITGANFLPAVVYLPALLVLCAGSVSLSKNKYRGEKEQRGRFNLLAICCLTTFCVAAVLDALVSTTFMKLIAGFFTN